MRVQDRADGVPHQPDRIDQRIGPQHAASDQVAMSARIFGQAVDDQIGPMAQRMQPARAEEGVVDGDGRSEEHTSELQSLMRTSYAVFCLQNKNATGKKNTK